MLYPWSDLFCGLTECNTMDIPLHIALITCLTLHGFAKLGKAEGGGKTMLRGAGASFPKTVYLEWISKFREKRRLAGVALEMNYNAVGSTKGKLAIMDKLKTEVEYAGSDVDLTKEEKKEYPNIIAFPTMAGPVVFGYNLDKSIDPSNKLNLSMETTIGIYNGTITSWDDPALVALNPNLTLPKRGIQVIARYDKSGTTHTVTAAFSQNYAWNVTYGTFSDRAKWNNNTIAYYGATTRGITGLILSFKYSIGYLGLADAEEAGMTYASLRNWGGHIVDPTLRSVQLAMEEAATMMKKELTVELSRYQNQKSYPIASFTYMLVRVHVKDRCDSMHELARYINWFMHDGAAIRACTNNKMVPISDSIAHRVEELILYKLTCNGQAIWPGVKAHIEEEKSSTYSSWHMATIVGITIFVTLVAGVMIYFLVRQIKRGRELDKDEWDVPIEDIVFYTTTKSSNGDKSRFVMRNSVRSLTDVGDLEDGMQMVQNILQWPGKWNGLTVGLRLLEIKNISKVSRSTKRLLLWMRDNIIHTNVLNFYGLAELQGERYSVSDYCSKGPLSDLLKDTKFNFNKDCKFSLALDVIGGLAFLHSKGIIHGNLRTTNCLVDFKWMVKIADWEYAHLFTRLHPKKDPLLPLRKSADEVGKDAAAMHEFWTAPELLRSDDFVHLTVSCDIYSYSIILQEIFTREAAYTQHLDTLTPSEVLNAVIRNNLRPLHNEDTPMRVRQILEYGWSEVSTMRPSCEQIQKMLKQAHDFKKTVLDNMVEASEDYTTSLEEKLQEKTKQLEVAEEKATIMYDYLVPPFLQKKVLGRKSTELDITSSASVIMVKVILTAKEHKKKICFAKEMDRIDKRLHSITSHFNSYKVDYTSGTFLFIYGAGSRAKRKAIQAARMAYEIITDDENEMQEPPNTFEVSYKCVIHHGSVYTGIITSGMPPKCYVSGEVIDETYRLLRRARPSMVLVSRNFKDALSIFALDYFRLETNTAILDESDEFAETYWLYRKEGMEYKKWSNVISLAKQREDISSTPSSNTDRSSIKRNDSRPNHSSSSTRSSSEELPMAKFSSALVRDTSRDFAYPPTVERSVSAPFISGLFNPFTTYRNKGPFTTRRNSFGAGTIGSLRSFLSRTLPSTPPYKMKIISQAGSEENSDNFDVLPA